MNNPTFEEVADFIAAHTGVDRMRVCSSAQVERDLGITGDDGDDLLKALTGRYGTDFSRPHHGDRYLFHSEGFDLLSPIISRMSGRPAVQVIPITIEDLYDAVVRGRWVDPPQPAS